ncbi:MAG: class I SAM-dependent methyltransferase [Candidatus Lokiarchaeota archaeon]|nr:class I SAM-dependent methyltransferase [Candidatus Lokiarchaeota archaeon]
MPIDFVKELNIDSLRESFLKYARKIFESLPKIEEPRILDVGCGSGAVSLELARLTKGRITSIDVDQLVLEKFLSKLVETEFSNRINIFNRSIYNTDFQAESFDIVWEEGMLHLVNAKNALKEIQKILKINGFFVALETKAWFESNLKRFSNHGFDIVVKMDLPDQCWLDEYYLPMERKIEKIILNNKFSEGLKKLKPFEDEIKMVKKNPKKFDCVYYVFKKIKVE